MTDERRAEVERRLDAARDVIERRGESGAWLATRRNFAWLTAGGLNHIVLSDEVGVAGLLVTAREAVCVTANIEAARVAEEELAGLGIETIAVPWWEGEAALRRTAAERLGQQPADDETLENDLLPLRSMLAPLDRERLTELGTAALAAVEGALDAVHERGMTEDDLAAELVGRLSGLRAPVVLVAADDRIARYRHPLPTSSPIRRRVMLVLVAEGWGLHVAVTRFRELEPPTADLASRIEAVAQVERAVHEATRPGATLGAAFAAAQRAYADGGYPEEWRDHHQGGTIAYQGRETIAVPDDPTPIVPGMAFAWNPSIAGAKVEDTFLLEPDGSRRVVTSGPSH